MSSIYKRKNKLWISYYVSGKEYREPLGLVANRQGWIDARKVQKIRDGELAQGIHKYKIKMSKGVTLSRAYNEFLKVKKNNAEATIINYGVAYKRLFEFSGDIRLNQIDQKFVERFEYHLRTIPTAKGTKLTQTSISTYFRTLRVIFKYFVEKEYIKSVPFPKIKAPDKEIITIPLPEIKEILEKMYLSNRKHYKTIMMFLLTGLRASELTRLRFEDIDLEKNLLTVNNSKGKRQDLFPIYPKLRDFLLDNFEFGKGKVFDYKNKESLKFWGKFLKRNGFKHYSIHTLRKTFITLLVNDGVNVFDVSKLARHKDIKTTLKSYASVELDRLGDCINGSAKIHTLIHTQRKFPLKLVK